MGDVGIEGDFEFSITVKDDSSIVVQSDDPRAKALEQAINADPALQKTLREMKLFSGHALEMLKMRELMEWMQEHENEISHRSLFGAVEAVRERIEGASSTVSTTGGATMEAVDRSVIVQGKRGYGSVGRWG